MVNVSYDELRTKEVINTNDCKRLGFITDLCIDLANGKIISFMVRDCSGFFPNRGSEISINWEDIKKIGDDIIIVDICYAVLPPVPAKKRFF